ncbi:unnamed protein product [Bursaphelenchus okinawaensis]|uniref:Smr domain-containing protein n=1 Tax=Bursaphelenchus okinawaensis TaxID=465554 RepID=A0A811KW56_9BILA|nr:unnamed protein product [Bursaphelenchus okinawaensis]CAG9112882.1 unnamed protein product [Bursaphelenchus okinawaensis]
MASMLMGSAFQDVSSKTADLACDTLELFFGSQMLTHLHNRFGNKSLSTFEARVVNVPVWIGELLYGCVLEQLEAVNSTNLIEKDSEAVLKEIEMSFGNDEGNKIVSEVANIAVDLNMNMAQQNEVARSSENGDIGLEMANLFVNTKVEEKLKPKRNPKPPPDLTHKDEKLCMLEQLREIFPQYPEKIFKQVLNEKNYVFDAAVAELANASTVGEKAADNYKLPRSPRIIHSNIATTVHRSSSMSNLSVVTNSSTSSTNTASSISSGISSAVMTATDYYDKAAYYRQLAAKLPNKNHPAYPQYLRLATECSQNAKKLQEEEEDNAAVVTDVLDLHGFEVARAIKILSKTIERIREKRPMQRYLEVITGIGNRNALKKAPLRKGIQLWLDQKKYRYEQEFWNQGSFKVHLIDIT